MTKTGCLSVCPSVRPLGCVLLPVFCALECLENIFLTFLPVSQSVSLQKAQANFQGVAWRWEQYMGFSPLKSCLRFPWLGLK